jgi:hypothetical protein
MRSPPTCSSSATPGSRALVPVSFDALMRAIELNGAAIEMNKTAFAWGRLAAIDLPAVLESAGLRAAFPRRDELRHVPAHGGDVAFLPLDDARLSRSLDEVDRARVAFLTEYQDAGYAKQLQRLRREGARRRTAARAGQHRSGEAVARYAFKLMAYKDEYEVARLYTSGDFQRACAAVRRRLQAALHLAPPLLAKKDAKAACSSASTARGCSPRSSGWRSCVPARRRASTCSAHRGAAHGASADRRLLRHRRRRCSGLSAATTRWRRRSRRSRNTSAATATSRMRTCMRRRNARRDCWRSGRIRRRRWPPRPDQKKAAPKGGFFVAASESSRSPWAKSTLRNYFFGA